MAEIFTTSYDETACELIAALIRAVDPMLVVEIGCQQGKSTTAIARGLRREARLIAVDRFEEKYEAPPYLETHASLEKTRENLASSGVTCQYEVRKQDGLVLADEIEGNIDALHIDVCNHLGNLEPILNRWQEKVGKLILLEGGTRTGNKWQNKYGFKPWREILDSGVYPAHWDSITIPFNDHNALTVMTRKSIK